jgi:hypothetical protein
MPPPATKRDRARVKEFYTKPKGGDRLNFLFLSVVGGRSNKQAVLLIVLARYQQP